MNYSSGTSSEPRHRNRPSLALIVLSLEQGGGGTRRAALSQRYAASPGPARIFWAELARNLPRCHVVPLGSRFPPSQDLGIPLSSLCLTNHCTRVETSRLLPLNREPTKWVCVELWKQATRRGMRDEFCRMAGRFYLIWTQSSSFRPIPVSWCTVEQHHRSQIPK